MVDPTHDRHPDLDVLADYAAGVLGQDECEVLERHLQDCHRCRLEARRLARFADIDQDEEMLAEAGWDEARFALERDYRDKVKPAIGATGVEPQPFRTNNPQLRWLVPVAAAAVLALVFIGMEREPSSPRFEIDGAQGDRALRGGGEQEVVIVPQSPVGEIEAAPEIFLWETKQGFETFVLEVVTSDLNTVFRQADITSSRLVLPDSLRSMLTVDTDYLWSVEGRTGLANAEISETAWFKIVLPSE